MENSFVSVVSEQKILSVTIKLLPNPREIIILNAIIQWQISIVIRCIRPWIDFIHNTVLLV